MSRRGAGGRELLTMAYCAGRLGVDARAVRAMFAAHGILENMNAKIPGRRPHYVTTKTRVREALGADLARLL